MLNAAQVLVVEDDPMIRKLLGAFLLAAGYRVTIAENGAAALKLLENEELPDAIVLDLEMPVLDGYGFRRLQQGNARFAEIPVIVSSGYPPDSSDPDLGDCLHVSKPIQYRLLIDAVELSIGGKPLNPSLN